MEFKSLGEATPPGMVILPDSIQHTHQYNFAGSLNFPTCMGDGILWGKERNSHALSLGHWTYLSLRSQ